MGKFQGIICVLSEELLTLLNIRGLLTPPVTNTLHNFVFQHLASNALVTLIGFIFVFLPMSNTFLAEMSELGHVKQSIQSVKTEETELFGILLIRLDYKKCFFGYNI